MNSDEINKMTDINEIDAAIDYLKSEEGTREFLTEKTLFDSERVERIYRLGQPWPLPKSEDMTPWIDEYKEAGLSLTDALIAINPIIDMELEEKESKLKAYKKTLKRGEVPESITGLVDVEFMNHVEITSNLSNESTETIFRFYNAICEHMVQLGLLIQRRSSLMEQ